MSKRKYFRDKMIQKLTAQVDQCLKQLKQADQKVFKYDNNEEEFMPFVSSLNINKFIELETVPDSIINLDEKFSRKF